MSNVFKQGTNQVFLAKLSINWDSITDLRCSFTQSKTKNCFLILEKERFTYEDGVIRATLTQEESFLFPPNNVILIQMRAEVNGKWQLSPTLRAVVMEAYDKEVVE